MTEHGDIVDRLREIADECENINHGAFILGTQEAEALGKLAAASRSEILSLRGEVERLRAALGAIDGLCTDEITVRFGGHSSKTESGIAKGSRVYTLLNVPRNIARQALQKV